MSDVLSTWLKDALVQTPGLVRKVAKRELILACREFYEQSFAWRAVVGPSDLTADQTSYTLSPYDDNADVIGVLQVDFNGRPLPFSPIQITRTSTSDSPYCYWLTAPDVVRFYPVPSITREDALHFHVALKPKLTTSVLPEIAKTNHYDALMSGLLSRVLAHPAKPYSNPVLAQYHMKRFNAAIGKYAAQAKKGFGSVSAWQFPRFGK